jgi:hypothetical protein
MAILESSAEKDKDDKRFLAALQGIDLDDNNEPDDILTLQGVSAAQAGFGVNLGLGYEVEGGAEIV